MNYKLVILPILNEYIEHELLSILNFKNIIKDFANKKAKKKLLKKVLNN